MFITFYDSDFNAIKNNSSLKIEKYSLKKRSYDLNDLELICEPIDLDTEPMFAAIKTDTGTTIYDCLAPIITRNPKDNKSRVIARDLKGLLNSEIVFDGTKKYNTIAEFLNAVFDTWQNFSNTGLRYPQLDTSKIDGMQGEVYQPTEKKVYNAWDIFKQAMAVYNLHLNAKIDYYYNRIVFTIERNDEHITKIKLEDYGIVDFNKTQPKINTAVVVNDQMITQKTWHLLQDGTISENTMDIIPASVKVFNNDTDAVLCLAENRNQEAIDIKLTEQDRLYGIDFTTSVMLYYKGKKYKQLPIGEIEYNNKGQKRITLGSKPLDFIQIV